MKFHNNWCLIKFLYSVINRKIFTIRDCFFIGQLSIIMLDLEEVISSQLHSCRMDSHG